jgi:uncharacterized protein with HEPN domain
MSRREGHLRLDHMLTHGLRNRLIHGYDAVDLDILWQAVTVDLPPLVALLEEILPPREESQP